MRRLKYDSNRYQLIFPKIKKRKFIQENFFIGRDRYGSRVWYVHLFYRIIEWEDWIGQ